MIHILVSKYELSEYIFSGLEGVDTIFVPVRKRNSFFHRVVKALYYNVCDRLYSYYYPSDVNKRLKSIPADDCLIVIGEDSYSYWMLSHLCKHVKNKVVYFWNPCSSIQSQKVCKKVANSHDMAYSIVEYIRSLGFRMATFDKGDSEKYNMKYFPQFYRMPVTQTCISNCKSDFFFCGRDKGRKEIINKMQHLLSQLGYCKFIIPETNGSDAIGYFSYLEEIRGTKIICEAVQPGQVGLTVRAVEALFHKKKLITNNKEIAKCDFYHPWNIFIFSSETNIKEIEEFINVPYINIEPNVINHYNVYTMVREMSEMKNHN